MGYASPLGVFIHPKGWVRPAGNNEPAVTATFADHIAGNRNPGVDIGTARCNDPLYAMEAGTVSLSGLIGTAQVVRVKHANGDESGYAHLSSRAVALGQAVKRGQLIGALGMTGATACHLHLGIKRNGVEIDAWPLLDQHSGGDMTPIPGAAFARLDNKTTKTIVPANFRADRLTTAAVLKLFPKDTAFVPAVQADDGTAAGGTNPTRWFGGFLYTGAGNVFGWFHSSVVGPLVDVAPPADCGPQVKAATDPLTRRIASIKQKVAANAADVADD